MAAYDLEEQERLIAVKDWWTKNGSVLTAVVLIAALSVLSWQGWGWYQRNQGAKASVLYGAMVNAVNKQDKEAVKTLSGQLISDFPNTAQAQLGALLAATTAIEAKDAVSAKPKLQFVAEKSGDALLREVARLRLASLQLDDKAFDAALSTLQATPNEAFAARFDDLRGDIYVAKGAIADARAAYQKAIDVMAKDRDALPEMRSLVQLKLEALGQEG